VQIGYAKR
jgi:hypothetical protein